MRGTDRPAHGLSQRAFGRTHTIPPRVLPGGDLRFELNGRWFPDAFIGPMSSLMEAITNETEPETSGSQTIGTMRLVEAVCKSHEAKQAVCLAFG
jgi:predicted dehydrogenase